MRRSRVVVRLCIAALLGCSDPKPTDAPPAPAAVPLDEAELLAELGYLASEPIPERSGVTRYDPAGALPGLNLYVSQHGQEARLLDLGGRTLHVWQREPEPGAALGLPPWWRTAHVFPNGDLLAQTDYGPLVRIDWDSNLLWAFRDRTHHDFDVREDGHVFVLTASSSLKRSPPFRGPIQEDFVVELDPAGREVRRVSVLEALVAGGRDAVLAELASFQRKAQGLARSDPLHTNSVEVLDGRLASKLPAFRRGNLLISLPTIGRLAVLDFDAGRVVWSLRGAFAYQHDPSLLPDGSLLLFDNRGLGERSQILQIDPLTGEELWSYAGPEAEPFYSDIGGRVHRLANGNTLIVESKRGRALEIDGRGTIVWEFRSPHRIASNVAVLNDVSRIGPAFLEGRGAAPE